MSESLSWDRFWYATASRTSAAVVRGQLCLIAIAYYAVCLLDVSFWFAEQGVLTPERLSAFVGSAGLEADALWNISPLFLTTSVWAYRLYLLVAMLVSAAVIFGKGGRAACVLSWLMFVGWVHREMLVVGVAENLMSLGLFAAAIAPAGSALHSASGPDHWSKCLSERLMAVQITLVGAATFVTMLGGRVWFNGLGAYAIAAPSLDRSVDWTVNSLFVQPWLHESLTHLMLMAIPLGFVLAWNRSSSRAGVVILLVWCGLVAILGSHWLYGAAFATTVLAIPSRDVVR